MAVTSGPAKGADLVVLASPRQSTAVGKWFRQLGAICRLNCILLIRYWKASLVQAIVLPVIVMGAIYGIQKAASSGSGAEVAAQLNVATWKLPGLDSCKPARDAKNPCITLAYTPQTPETTEIINIFRTKNQLRMGRSSPLQLESNIISDPAWVPSRNMDIVPLTSEQFLYQYALDHPNTIQLGVAFTKQGGGPDGMTPPIHWAYQVWYNATTATNMTVNGDFKYSAEAGSRRDSFKDDPYGVYLPSMMRSIDEAIMSFIQTTTDKPTGKASPATVDLDYSLKSYPIPASKNAIFDGDSAFTSFANLLAIPACISMVMAVLRVTREKETKVRESMEMMGLNVEAYWVAQWLTAWIMAIIQSLVLVALGYAFGLKAFTNANPLIWIIFLTLFSYAMTIFGFFVATFCQRVGTALGLSFAVVVAALVTIPIIAMDWVSLWIKESDTDSFGQKHVILSTKYVVQYFFAFINFGRFVAQLSEATSQSYNYEEKRFMPTYGFHWSNMTEYFQKDEDFQEYLPQPVTAFYSTLVNAALFIVLTWYFDQVIPKASGRRSEPWLFFLTRIPRAIKKMFSGKKGNDGQVMSAYEQEQIKKATAVIPYEGQPPEDEDDDVIAERERAVNCEREVAVRISNLTKIYKKPESASLGRRFLNTLAYIFTCGCCRPAARRARNAASTKRAVDRLNMIAESGELLALLGPNGAGKSTTMQILYGVTAQDSGTAFLFHRSIDTDRQDIKATLGVCPQHDVLIADLSVMEHMQLYAAIKDLPDEAWKLTKEEDAEEDSTKKKKKNDDFTPDVKDAFQASSTQPTWIKSRLQAVQLWKDRHTYAGRLSGGMKRRLSTILATVGDPKVLILDEPTTGMDPVHRRHVWTFLAQFKRSRSIILTTHSMEEADALGDKVAILVKGHLKAIGNTTRLKNKFGNGYRVEIGLADIAADNNHTNNGQSAWSTEKDVSTAVRSVMPESELIESASSLSAGILVFGIPPDRQSLAKMSELTALLERAQKQGVIKHWGIAQSSLEEVFLSLVQEQD